MICGRQVKETSRFLRKPYAVVIEATYAGVEYFRQKVSKDAVIVSANPTCTKKARDFQSGL